MTAKEALRAIVEDLREDEAERIFPFLSGRVWNGAPERRLSNAELLRLPKVLRDHIIRAEVEALTQQDLDEMVAESEEWRFSDADALKHIDD